MENSYLYILTHPSHEHFWLAAMIAYMALSMVVLLVPLAIRDIRLAMQGKLK